MKRGRYGLAVADYDSAQRLDPANSQIKKNRDEALQKFRCVMSV